MLQSNFYFLRHALFGCLAALVCCNSLAFADDDKKDATQNEGADKEGADKEGAEIDAGKLEFFEKKIRPVLVERCYKCHSAGSKKVEGGLLLDSREAIRKGGESGPAVVPHKPDESLILDAIRYESFEMPPDAKLSKQIVADFDVWIRQGAVDPRENSSSSSELAKEEDPSIDFVEARKYWAFQRPQAHPVPKVVKADWPLSKLDYFALAAMEEQKLSPAAKVDKNTFVRRAFYDIIGLPPTPEELQEFINDDDESAYEALVDRLLNSPRFGEKWSRMWLDLARYAEDQAHIVGNNKALFFPNAYLYRDWLIRAMNDDLPYDEFIRRQLAADMIEGIEPAERVALGFIGLGPKYYRRNDPEVMADEWEDRVDTVSRGLLGLTVACARCHDHKFDPIETEDYYALAGVFASTKMFNAPMTSKNPDGKGGDPKKPDPKKPDPKKPDPKKPEQAMHIVKEGKVANIKVHIRGNVKTQGAEVPRRFIQVLCEDGSEPKAFSKGSGRLELANAIVARENPLAARVFVNRIWGQLFGKYLVATPSNFGALGERPSHPELLDDLAVRFMDEGWSLKKLIREIVLSATYRQSCNGSEAGLKQDPSNRYLSRMNRRRLSVESWRDGVLSVTGQLATEVGGKSIDVDDPKQTRRSVYSKVSRFELNSMLAMFDFPDPNVHAARRIETTTALQKLFNMNSPFMIAQSKQLAKRIEDRPNDAGSDKTELSSQIRYAYELLFARLPAADEIELATVYLDVEDVQQRKLRWEQYAQLLLISNEMMYID
jgi:hypothetical protein